MKSVYAAAAMLIASVTAQSGDVCVDTCMKRYDGCCTTKNVANLDCRFFLDCGIVHLDMELFCIEGNYRECTYFCSAGDLVVLDEAKGEVGCGH